MEGADALGLIAEVGIAIAGFAGVIATLRAPRGGLGAYAAFRIGLLLGTSAEAVVFALLPFALHFAGIANTTIWALCSVVMAPVVVAVFLVNGRIAFVKGVFRDPEERSPGYRYATPIILAVLTGVVVLQVSNVALFRELWPFYLGLLGLTALSLFEFAYILFAPSRSEVQA